MVAYLIGLAIALLVLAGIFGLGLVALWSYPVGLAVGSVVLAGLVGWMIVLVVRSYRYRYR